MLVSAATVIGLNACSGSQDAVMPPDSPPGTSKTDPEPAGDQPEAPAPSTTKSDGASTSPAPTTAAPATTAATTTSSSPTTLAPLQGLAYAEVASGLPFPILALSPPADDRLFIATKDGQVWIHDGTSVGDTPFLDIRDLVRNDGEQGLLGMAFHPDYPDDGRFFVHYTSGGGDTVLAEYGVDAEDPSRARPDGTVIFTADQPAANHNGGMLQFGRDGFLYLGLGDGGAANDRFGHGQRADTVLGALLRLDVSMPGTQQPAQTPTVAGGDPRVWAYGLRNPWRFAIDGDLIYIGDVGQANYEEISVARIDTGGLNFGWPITEALHCFSPRSGCSVDGLTLPLVEIPHSDAGTCSITGGLVYRGSAIPELEGHYFYSDFCGGYLRSFVVADGVATGAMDWTDQVGALGSVTSFGQDAAGELYVLTAGGSVLRIEAVR